MPELNSIQTYEKINGSNFRPSLNRFCKVLKRIGLWNDEINNEFDSFEWKVEENGFVYFSNNVSGQYVFRGLNVKIRPIITGYTPLIDKKIKDTWIGIDLLIETEDLKNLK